MEKKYPNRHVYKISSEKLMKSKWDLKIDLNDAIKKKEVVDLADSTALRFIRSIIHKQLDTTDIDVKFTEDIKKLKHELNMLKKEKFNTGNAKKYKELSNKYHRKLLIEDYLLVQMTNGNKKHFDRANKGFFVNGKKFEYLLSTTGGVKNETVVYVSAEVYPELNRRIDNGRNMAKEFVPAKASAYRSLVCSASILVPPPTGVTVVKDFERTINEDVILIKNNPDPNIKRPLITEENIDIKLNTNDGYGLITPNLAKKWADHLGLSYVPSAFIVRNAFCKGVLAVMNFHKYSKKVTKNKVIIDAWGNFINIKKHKIEMVLTTSMLKMWQSYTSMDDYLRNCSENGYAFSITKCSPEHLETQRNLNYQFIQSLSLSDNAIEELTRPTIETLKDAMGGDWAKTLLYLKGNHLTEKSNVLGIYDFSEALTIDKRMISDPFVKQRIKDMINKRIDDAKKGDLIVEGNFKLLVGDVVLFCNHMFNKNPQYNPQGILQKGEFYSHYWNNLGVDEVVGFRAPMTVYNNIRKMNIVQSDEMKKWFKHLKNVFIVNSYDLTLNALNGADLDGDSLLSTNNSVLKRAVNNTKIIVCEQATAQKAIPNRELYIQADKNGFGNKIGGITNKGTSLYEVLSKFEPESEQYKEVMFRIMSIQKGQQDEIDKMKGVTTKPLPKGWFDKKEWSIKDGDTTEEIQEKSFNLSLVADVKPYFFIYVYPYLMNTYKDYNRKANTSSVYQFGIKLDHLLEKEFRSEDEEGFVRSYYERMPISLANSTSNRVCRKIENEFKNVSQTKSKFDYNILKSGVEYSKDSYNKILKLYHKHNELLQDYRIIAWEDGVDEEEAKENRKIFVENFKHEAYSINNNEEEIGEIVLDICYGQFKNRSKQFAWDIAGKQILKNLLMKNDNIVSYPLLDDEGDIEFRGEHFKIITKEVEI